MKPCSLSTAIRSFRLSASLSTKRILRLAADDCPVGATAPACGSTFAPAFDFKIHQSFTPGDDSWSNSAQHGLLATQVLPLGPKHSASHSNLDLVPFWQEMRCWEERPVPGVRLSLYLKAYVIENMITKIIDSEQKANYHRSGNYPLTTSRINGILLCHEGQTEHPEGTAIHAGAIQP